MGGYNAGLLSGSSYSVVESFVGSAFSSFAVTLTSISPTSGYNTGKLGITVKGGSFVLAGAVRLEKGGETTIDATSITYISSEELRGV